MKTEKQESLSHMKETARRAFYWTSFDPEKRGDRVISEYSTELDSDIELLTKYGAEAEQLERYKKDYEKMLSAYLHSHSNVASSAIAGPANFPVARNQKRSAWADNHFNKFREFRTKVFAAYERGNRKRQIAEAGGELEINKKKLSELEALQEYMKRINKAYSAYKKNANSLQASGLSESEQQYVIQWFPKYEYLKKPFQSFQLTNNLAKIKNTQERITILESKKDLSASGTKEIPFASGIVIMNYEIDRLLIKHNEKPSPEVISSLKSSGFHWSPFNKAWMRKITPEAICKASKLLSIEI